MVTKCEDVHVTTFTYSLKAQYFGIGSQEPFIVPKELDIVEEESEAGQNVLGIIDLNESIHSNLQRNSLSLSHGHLLRNTKREHPFFDLDSDYAISVLS